MLTAHIVFSVGWLGAVAVFLVLAITGRSSDDVQLARSSYLAMDLSAWYILVPFSIASLLTGILQALGTPWGLFKHYWIIIKLLLTVACTFLLLLHMQPISYMAEMASATTINTSEFNKLRTLLVTDAAAAIFVLLFITVLSIYKPWGRTKFGLRKKNGDLIMENQHSKKTPWGKYIVIAIFCILATIIIIHLAGGGMRHH
jgi:hypothetical protein